MRWAITLAALLALCVMSAVNMFLPYANARGRVTDGAEKILTKDDGRTIAYFVQGSGKSIILLPSVGREASDFNELAATLITHGYRTIAIEPPGIGQSALPDNDMTLFDLADDVAAVLRAELTTRENAVIIGHAFGNRVARATAASYGDQVDALILIAAGGKQPIPPRADRALKASFNPLNVASRRIGDIRYAFFANGNTVPDYWQRGWHINTAQLQAQAVRLTDAAKWWLGGNKPILVIQGDKDTIAPIEDAGQALVDDGKGRVEMVVVRKAGHALLPERPRVISDAVLAYLAQLSGGGSES
ncbi:alpha/beta fold hydrolase [Parasphingorhabdus sp. DH2-15]|uniref:alpha/beta fold hydrolase n=1 Tax=Parasphingorhabdus sp. DH2-15 TaxID=3444112 RepID=UPI003F68594B